MTLSPTRTLIVDLPGPDLDAGSAALLARYMFGGVCLFLRNVTTPQRTARLVQDIRAVLGPEALIAIDQEGGAVLRRLDTAQVPAPMGLSAALLGRSEGEQVAAAREAGAIAARGLLELGINWNYAPTLDVNVNPANPVIGERSFGADPELVARLGVAWAQGSEAAGVLSTVKHFPGHGDTVLDSHLTLPRVAKSREQLEATEWVPFRAAVRAGVGSVMTAHIVYPALDPERPATLSRAVLSGLLRGEWGYDGVIVTDAADMLAIRDHYPAGSAGPLSLMAGADAVLNCGHGDERTHHEYAQAVTRAYENGQLPEARLEEALRRLARAARQFPGTPRPYPEPQKRADQETVDGWYRAGITRLERGKAVAQALDPAGVVLLLAPRDGDVGGPYNEYLSGEALAAALGSFLPALHTALLSQPDDMEAARELLALYPAAPVLLASTGRWAVPPAFRTLEGELRGRQVQHLAIWNPYLALELPYPALLSYGFRPGNLHALGQALLSGQAGGRLPFDLPAG